MQFFQDPLFPVIDVPSKPSFPLFPMLFPQLSVFSLPKDMSMPVYLGDYWLYFNARCCYVDGWSPFLFCYAAVIWPCNIMKGPCSRYTLLLVYLTSLYPPWVLWGGSSGKNLILPLPLLKELAIYPSCWCTYTHVLNGLVGNHFLEVAGGNCCIKILCSLFAMQDCSRIVRTSPRSWLEMP